jgi:hypothetical protein
LWDDVRERVKAVAPAVAKALTVQLRDRLKVSGKIVLETEKRRFEKRRKELERAIGENQITKLETEAAKARDSARQLSFLGEQNQERAKALADLEAEIALRKNHYDQVQERLANEEKRTMELILPPRYKLRGDARVYPLAVEIRLPAGSTLGAP